jgi:hypothetical protein
MDAPKRLASKIGNKRTGAIMRHQWKLWEDGDQGLVQYCELLRLLIALHSNVQLSPADTQPMKHETSVGCCRYVKKLKLGSGQKLDNVLI